MMLVWKLEYSEIYKSLHTYFAILEESSSLISDKLNVELLNSNSLWSLRSSPSIDLTSSLICALLPAKGEEGVLVGVDGAEEGGVGPLVLLRRTPGLLSTKRGGGRAGED